MTTTAQLPVPGSTSRSGQDRAPLRLVTGTGRAGKVSSRPRSESSGPLGGVKSVTTALEVLDCFVDVDELGVSDIARRLGVAKSTAHRLLTSLAAHGLVDKNPETGHYRLGLHLFELGQLAGTRLRLRRTAMPLLEELRQVSGCSVQLAVADGADVVFLERLETLRDLQGRVALPHRLPAHTTSSGKAMAAFSPDLVAACRAGGFPALTPATITSLAEFDRALADIRRRGVSTSLGEAVRGYSSVAAPVLDSAGRARAAVSVLRPGDDLGGDLGRLSQLVGVVARRLTRLLGV